MKRLLTVLLVALFLLLTSCASQLNPMFKDTIPRKTEETKLPSVLTGSEILDTIETTEEKPTPTSKVPVSVSPTPNAFDEEAVLSQLQITTYKMYDAGYYAFIEIANNSKYDLAISVDLKFYDDNDALIGADNVSERAVQSGTTVLFYTSPDEDFSKIDYEVSVEEEEYFECLVKDLSFESVSAKYKEIVTIKNNSKKPAMFVDCYLLFFKGDQVVGFSHKYFTDDDSELKPGKSITEEMDCYEEYDSYKYYLTGKIDK